MLESSWIRESVLAETPPSPLRGSQRKDPNAWIALLEQYLPPSLREGGAGDDTKTEEDSSGSEKNAHEQSRAIATLLFQARNLENLDLLAHLGFQLRRWSAVHALVNKLLDSTEALKEVSKVQLPSNIEWGTQSSLDDLTSRNYHWNRRADIRLKSDGQSSSASKMDLDAITDRPFALWLSQIIMREVWQSLGHIILEAADLSPNESRLPMSYVYQILARLHHSDSIPDSVYKYLRPQNLEAPFRPPGMFLLSTHIMNVLSDTVWLAHEAEVSARAAAAGDKSPFRPFKMPIRELGPEIWLEFVLWCCVEDGFVKEGVWILQRMKAREGDLAWSVKSWKPLLEHPETVRDTNIDVEDFWRRPGDPPVSRTSKSATGVFHGLGKRTISVEVITSLMDGVVNPVYRGLGYRGLSPGAVLQYLLFLNSLVAPATKILRSVSRVSNWSVVRMIESGGIDPEADPQALERLLRAQSHIVPPWDDHTSTLEEDLDRLTRPQMYDDSSALMGLLEYNLKSYAVNRHTGGALDIFAWLQELVDSSKLQHIYRFLEEARDLNDEDLSAPDEERRTSLIYNIYGSSIPQLSNVTLANLLDLATTSGAFRFGEWLLFSTDVDGPVIPFDAYGDQALAPSIIRFATATRNTLLCNKVVESLSQPVSRNTLKALLNFRITMGDWDRVVAMFEYLRDHRSKSWGDSNATALAAAVLKLDRAAKHKKSPSNRDEEDSLSQAKVILLRLLNGEFNPPANQAMRTEFYERAVYRLYQVFKSIPGPLEEVCGKAELKYTPTSDRDILPYIPSAAFHNLLAAVVTVQGSAAGQKLWERWCLERETPAGAARLHEGGVPRLYTTDERDYNKGDPVFDPKWLEQAHKKAVIPNLNTVRIIAQQAVKEYRVQESQKSSVPPKAADITLPSDDDSAEQPSSSPAAAAATPEYSPEDVLDFCVAKFKKLRLYEKEIDREVQGHLSRMKKRSSQGNK